MLELREYKFAIIFTVVIALVIGTMVFAEVYKTNKAEAEAKAQQEAKLQELARYDYLTDEQNPIATITMSDGKKIVLELYPKEAPTTVENFISLANSGFYNGVTFHRTEPEFVIQGGSKTGTGVSGETEYTIEGEFSANGIENSISHVAGVISMARNGYSYNSAYSQFFITVVDAVGLDGSYAAFGRVIEGMDVVNEIANVEVVTRDDDQADANKPINPPVMESVTVDTKGIQYDEPKHILTNN